MSQSNQKSAVILLLIAIVGMISATAYALLQVSQSEIIPIFQLPSYAHFLLFAFGIPVIGSLLTAVIMPRIIAPLYLSMKRVVVRGSKDAYIAINPDRLSLKRWFGRTILVVLLIFGFMAAIINVVDPRLFMTQDTYNDFLAETGLPQYNPSMTLSLAGFIAPFAFGLWAASWIIEDAGLIQYRFPDSDTQSVYEVDPVQNRYKGYLKGYAGVSSLLFFLSVFLLFSTNVGTPEPAAFTLIIPLINVICTIPGYLVYSRLGVEFLRKGLPKAGMLSESDLNLSD